MEKAKTFEDLRIWQQARILVKEIYQDFSHGRGSRNFGFHEQIQRVGISIMNNIAEGFERKTDIEFARFLDISKGSCGETRSMYYTAEDLGYLNSDFSVIITSWKYSQYIRDYGILDDPQFIVAA